MSDDRALKLVELRAQFPRESIGRLPKGGIMLDYVGHAAVTNRLLNIDPEWSWEPLGVDERGLPALDAEKNLWIRLTVLGVTRIGVGDGKTMKERIGDAIRNAAMRFGVALDLWAKEELEHGVTATPMDIDTDTGEVRMVNLRGPVFIELKKLETQLGVDGDDNKPKRLAFYKWVINREVTTSKELTEDEAVAVVAAMSKRLRERQGADA